MLQQHSTILPTSTLISHLSPPYLLASDHARSSRAAGTKVTQTCRQSEGRFNGLIAILFRGIRAGGTQQLISGEQFSLPWSFILLPRPLPFPSTICRN